MLPVAAPFGRVWLAYLSPTPKPQLTFGFSYFSSLTTLSGPVYFGAGSFDPTRFVKLLHDDATPVEWLDKSLAGRHPLIAEVGAAGWRLSDYFVARLLGEADPTITQRFFDLAPASPVARFAADWLEARAIAAGLPYNGAGTELGLVAYIAARANVSEPQLKAYYWAHRGEYSFRASQRTVFCEFDDMKLARKWRETVLLAPFEIWTSFSQNGIGVRCDANPNIVPLPPLPAPSRSSLTPIAGGFVTPVTEFKTKFYFALLYGFHPALLTKPFVTVRDGVEKTYRNLVAAKRLEAFKAKIFERAGARNSLAEAAARLEQP